MTYGKLDIIHIIFFHAYTRNEVPGTGDFILL